LTIKELGEALPLNPNDRKYRARSGASASGQLLPSVSPDSGAARAADIDLEKLGSLRDVLGEG